MSVMITTSVAACFLALAAASITDLKTREVPDWISYSLIVFSIGNAAILSVFHANAGFLSNAIVGALAGLAIGLFMFYAGQWGGGDSKLTIGICSILGISIPAISNINSAGSVAMFILNTLIVGAAYGLIFTLSIALLNWTRVKEYATANFSDKKMAYLRIALFLAFAASLATNLFNKDLISLAFVLISGATLAIMYVWMLVSSVEKTIMIKALPVEKLTEGDWITEPVVKNGKTILQPTKTGIDIDGIQLLKKNKIKSVIVKEGIPFVPSLLIALALTLIFGNWIIALI